MDTSAATLTRQRVKDIFDAEFSSEGWECRDDKLLRASGHDGVTHAAVYPEAERERSGKVAQLEVPVVLQLYLGFDSELEEDKIVDPTVIEGYAHRIRKAFNTQSSGTLPDLWFVRLTRIEYPDDPTGNKTRLEAFITGYAQNDAGIVETY